jgi:lambda repressor-like predicted transcriptional regulator
MFENLKAEMARKGITIMDISRDLDFVYETLRNKFNGKTDWLRSEMIMIRDKYFPDKTLEYLFQKNEK